MIAGVDYSTKAVDIVLLDEDTDHARWHWFPFFGQDAFDRTRSVRAEMPGSSFWDDVIAVGIEDPRGYGAGSLYRIQGAILACLPRTVLVHPLIPSSWRKTNGLRGNASKDDVYAYANAKRSAGPHSPFDYWSQDACDAFCIALATRTLLQRTEAA